MTAKRYAATVCLLYAAGVLFGLSLLLGVLAVRDGRMFAAGWDFGFAGLNIATGMLAASILAEH